MFIPHLHLEDSKFLFCETQLPTQWITDTEVVVVQRQATPANYKALQVLHKQGKKIVYDLDDNVWCLPASNPAQKFFKVMQEGFQHCSTEADVVTVSTQGLKSAVMTALPRLKVEILVTPNAMDFDLFKPLDDFARDDGKVIIGWAGSNTHAGDLGAAWDVLPDLMRKFPETWLEVVGGHEPPRILFGHPHVIQRPWYKVGEFANRCSSWSWDIALAPLDDNRFNNSKSCIKALEAAALRIPCLMSNVRPYHEFACLGGEELKWLLCSSKNQWQTKLEKLVADTDYRRHLGELMYKTAKQHFDINTLKENWRYALRHAMGWN